MAVIFAREMTDEKLEDIPIFKLLSEWELLKSTKIDACAQLCLHFLARDDAPDPIFEDGKLTFPPMPSSTPFTQTQKILIYQEFPSLGSVLRNVSLSLSCRFVY